MLLLLHMRLINIRYETSMALVTFSFAMSMTVQLLIGLSLKSVTLPEILIVCCAKVERLATVNKKENNSFISFVLYISP